MVTLEGDHVVKRHQDAEICLREAQALEFLHGAGLAVPAILSAEDHCLTLEYIPGDTYADLTEAMTSAKAEALSCWLVQYHGIAGCLRGDVNLRNFLWTGQACVGVDFEDPPIPGPVEIDMGKIIAFGVTYEPSLTEKKAWCARLLLEAFLRTGADYELIRDAYLEEILAINRRRAAVSVDVEKATLFFAALIRKEVYEMTTKKHEPSLLEQVAAIASKWKNRPDMLIPVLHEVQAVAGNCIPKEVAQTVAEEMRIPLAQIYSAATFYSFFSLERRGKILIRLCKTAPCHVKGTKETLAAFEQALGIKEGETTPDGLFSLETCECIGACDVSPAALVDDTVYGHLTPEKVNQLVVSLREAERSR